MTYRHKLALAAAVSTLAFVATPANASLVFDSTILLPAQGFGNAPRAITIMEIPAGKTGTESGCVGVGGTGSTIVIGSGGCIPDAQVFLGNGVTNVGGDEPSPQADNQKYGIPLISELGWDDASDVGLLFNATEEGGDSINVLDVTLKFYDGTNLLGAIDGQHSFASSEPGNGVAGFTFVVDAAQQTFLNNLIFSQQGFGDFRIALESTLSDVGGGPETWLAFNLGAPIPEPATWGLMILGVGMIGGVMRRRQRQTVGYRFA